MMFCRCRECSMEFKGYLSYCPFCGNELQNIGVIIGGKSLQDDLEGGWKLIMFRHVERRHEA